MAESLSESVREAGPASGISEDICANILEQISLLIPEDRIGAHYVVSGPLPAFPETQMDIWILTKNTLYNYMVREEGSVKWFALPLTQIAYFSEAEADGDWNLLRIHGTSGSPNLAIQELVSNWDKLLQRFVGELVSSI